MRPQQMRLATWNCCSGLSTKTDFLKDFLKLHKIDIICLQETELKERDEESDYFNINNYLFEPSLCKPNSRTCIYVKNDLIYERIVKFYNDNLEIITLRFSDFVLISYYRTFKIPENYSHYTHFKKAVEIFEKILFKFKNTNIIIMSDFNLDYLKH